MRAVGSRTVSFWIWDPEEGESPPVRTLMPGIGGEMKGASVPALVGLPPPLFLWRVKAILFLLWNFCCCKIGWDSVMSMTADLRYLILYEAFLYYNPLFLVALMIWLWGVNLWIFAQSSVNYVKVFDLAQTHLSHREIWRCATWFTLIVSTSMTSYLYLYSHGEVSLAASQPCAGILSPEVLVYAILLIILISPLDMFYLSSRIYFLRSMWRTILPLQASMFPNFFLADIFTSMPKVFSDLERSVCRMVNSQVATTAWFEADSVCGSHSIAIPLVLMVPYLCCFFQCLRHYRDTKEKSCILNALKYSTAVLVIFLSAYKYHVLADDWVSFYRPLWLISGVINMLYSFYWDINHDWDLSILTKLKRPSTGASLLYERTWVYYWVLGSNLVLRCTWTYNLSLHLWHNYLTVFAITALEMLRRFQWVFFRVKNECNKMTTKQNSEILSDMPSESDRLLDSTSHTAILFLLWNLLCCKIGWDSVMRMTAGLRDLFLYETFLYYNPLFLVALMIWLWGVNLWVFAQSSVNYAKVFDLAHNHLSHREIWRCATWLTLIVSTSMTAYLYLYSHGEMSLAAYQPFLVYAILLIILLSPLDMFYLSSRFYFLGTIWRSIFPLQAITFADLSLAEIFTSMSKVFSDLERSVCRMVNSQVATTAWYEADSICGSHSIAIPLVRALPYLCRFFQCLRQYKDTKEKSCLLNALKYLTAVPVIFLSALKYHVFPDQWVSFYQPLWLISCVINSLYSFYWDIKHDWDLSILTRIFMFKSPSTWTNLLYGQTWVYYWVLGSNFVLRCTWTYNLSAHLRHNYLTMFAITALEMLRRFQWILYLVENEWNMMTAKQNFVFLSDMLPAEADRLLDSNSHTV